MRWELCWIVCLRMYTVTTALFRRKRKEKKESRASEREEIRVNFYQAILHGIPSVFDS